MRTERFQLGASAVAAGLAALLAVAARADTRLIPETRQVGATAIVYHGPTLNVALSYRFPKLNPSGEWLMLDTAMTATSDPVEVPRTAIAVRTPTGAVVPLASQRAFGLAYAKLASAIHRANVTREPLAYLVPHRPGRLDYFATPGRGLAFESAWLDDWHSSYGRLYFRLPQGVQKGSYELLINLPHAEVSIPFTI